MRRSRSTANNNAAGLRSRIQGPDDRRPNRCIFGDFVFSLRGVLNARAATGKMRVGYQRGPGVGASELLRWRARTHGLSGSLVGKTLIKALEIDGHEIYRLVRHDDGRSSCPRLTVVNSL